MSLAPARKTGPLGDLQSDADALKIKINELNAVASKWSFKTADNEQVVSCHQSGLQCQREVEALLERAKRLQLHDEPTLPSNFDEKKDDEIKRLQSFQQKLMQLFETIEKLPKGVNLKVSREKEIGQLGNEEDPKQEESEDDDEMNESDLEVDLYRAIQKFNSQQEGDLSLQVDEIVDVLRKQKDGWWEAENEKGDRGMVPSNFLEPYKEDEEESEEVDEVSEETKDEEEEKERLVKPPEKLVKPPVDIDAEEPSVAEEATSHLPATVSSSKLLWKGVRETVVGEPTKLDVTDVLSAMGAFPSGFRPSLLYSFQHYTNQYSLKSAILPKVSESKLSYQDLFWDPVANNIRPIVTRVLRNFKIWKCTQIPLPGSGIEILSRHVRYGLFDGSKILSNIVIVRAQIHPNKPKMWQFATSKAKEGGIIPTLLHAGGIVRTDNVHANLGIVFELGLTYVRNQTGEKGELSCGWSHLKLFDDQGNHIQNKTYELMVNGGTVFEKGVPLDPTIERRSSNNRFLALISASKQPKLFVQIRDIPLLRKKHLDNLPPTIVFPSSYSFLLAAFRTAMAEALIRNHSDLSNAGLVHAPVLAAFLGVVDQTDIMDALLRNWIEKERLMTKGEKRDEVYQIEVFKAVVMETAYPILHINSLPEIKWGNLPIEEAHSRFVNSLALATRQEKGVLKHFLTSNTDMEPFDIAELTFDPLVNAARVFA